MSAAVLEKRSKPVIRKPSGDTLDALRRRVATVSAELRRLESERARCESEAAEHREVIQAAAQRRADLVALHERRASGTSVSTRQLSVAERNVAAAEEQARRAQDAEQGVVAAVARYLEQEASRQAELSELAGKARRLQLEAIHARALRSRERYRAECEKLAVAYADHVGDVLAGELAAKALGISLSDLHNELPASVRVVADAA